jgi:hypothetical protein
MGYPLYECAIRYLSDKEVHLLFIKWEIEVASKKNSKNQFRATLRASRVQIARNSLNVYHGEECFEQVPQIETKHI